MKKTMFYLLAGLPLLTLAQTSHLGVSGGYAENGFAFLVNYNYGLTESSYLQAGAYGSFAKSIQTDQVEYEIPYSDFSLNIGYYQDVFRNRTKQFKVSIGGGGVAGYELVNGGDSELETGALVEAENQFIYGAFAGVEVDIVLNDAISIYGAVNEYYHLNSDLGNFVFYGGVGIKYYIF